MRAAFLVTVLLCSGIVAFAQGSADSASPTVLQPAPQAKALPAPTPEASRANRNLNAELAQVVPNNEYCLTMRTYLFSASENGNPPRLVRYTTCTPSNMLQRRNAQRPARFVPQ